jgi:hypothetical protein
MSLDDLEKKLYQSVAKNEKEVSVKREEKASPEGVPQGPPEWEEDKEALIVRTRGGAGRIIKWLFALVGAFAIVGGGIFFAFRYGTTAKGVAISVQGPREVNRGVPFEISVQIANDIDSFVKEGALSVTFTGGILSADNFSNKTVLSESVGDLGGGSLTRKAFKFFAVGETNSVQKVRVKFSFVSGRTQYEIQEEKEITIGDPAIAIEIKKPDQVVSGSDYNMQIEYKNVSQFDFSDVALQVKYPGEFSFKEASYNPASLDNFWRVGEVKAGAGGSIQITGSLDASEKNSFDFPASAFVTFLGSDYLVAEKTANVFIAPSPIILNITANGSDRYVARVNEKIVYAIRYENKSGISLADTVIEARLSGDVFDFSTIQTNGGFDSRTNTIVWNASRVPELALLSPGGTGEVRFEVRTLPTLPVKRASDKNFVLTTSARMDSPSVPYYLSADKTSGFASSETRVAGVVMFDAQGFYRDSLAQIVNNGTLPPKVNAATQYTIHWVIKNYGSDLRDVVVKGSLEGGVRWTGVVKSNIGSVPEYNSRTQEVTWSVDKIQANRGLFGDVVEAVFQVEGVPNITQEGGPQRLVGISLFSAIDDFTGTAVSGRDDGITTALPDDKTVGRGEGTVVK